MKAALSKSGKRVLIVAGLLAVMPLAGCAQRSPASASANHAARQGVARATAAKEKSAGLVFYYEQEYNPSGDNPYRKDYRSAAAVCKQKPGSQLLTPAQAAKVGTSRKQYWWDGNRRSAEMDESWKVAMGLRKEGPHCVFKLVHTEKLKIAYPNDGRIYTLDLMTHKGMLQRVPPFPASRQMPAPPPDWERARDMLVEKAGKSSAAGQPCTILRSKLSDGLKCVWTGGTQWGYGVLDGDTPILWEKGKDGETSMMTDKFVVGHLPDAGIFNLPQGVKIVDEGGP